MLNQHHTDTLYAFLTHRRYRVWRHVLFIAMLVPIGLSQSFFALGGKPAVPVSTIYLFGACFSIVTLAIVYLNSYYLAPRLLPKGRYASYLVTLVGIVFIFVVLKYTTEHLILLKAGFRRVFNGIGLLDAFSNGIIYAVCIVSASVTLLLRQWNSDQTTIASLARKQLENSIDELKSRIHPVFLYATLDGAARTVRRDPEQASDMLFMLSELLNYQLYDATRKEVLLTAEIACIRRYLTLKQLNSEHPFFHTVTVDGDDHRLVPPVLFLPWIDEIVRHDPSALSVVFTVDDSTITFTCRVVGMGWSLCNFDKAEQKIMLFYGDKAAIRKTDDSMMLTIPLKRC